MIKTRASRGTSDYPYINSLAIVYLGILIYIQDVITFLNLLEMVP